MVDTIGFKNGGWMDEDGSPSSDKLHLTELITRSKDGREIDDTMTIDGRIYYNAPFVFWHKYAYAPKTT